MARIVKSRVIGTSEEKRFYLPGVLIRDTCPKCDTVREFDGDSEYVCYPKLGTKEEIQFYCEECGHEWKLPVVIEVVVKLLS